MILFCTHDTDKRRSDRERIVSHGHLRHVGISVLHLSSFFVLSVSHSVLRVSDGVTDRTILVLPVRL
jgi:hypothetical protein